MSRDEGTMGDFWRDVGPGLAARGKAKRASNRAGSAQILREQGIEFQEKNRGAHLIVRCGDVVVDFWPGTGKWIVRGSLEEGRGVRPLLNLLRRVQNKPKKIEIPQEFGYKPPWED